MILLGIQGLETGKIGVPDEDLRLSLEGVITKVNNLNKTLREQKITIVSKDLGSFMNVEKNEYSIDVARLVHVIEEQNPDYLVLAFDYSSFNEINTILRAEGVYARTHRMYLTRFKKKLKQKNRPQTLKDKISLLLIRTNKLLDN